MKKITKILALSLALVTLALSCTSCGNLFISNKEKAKMASNMRNETLIRCGTRRFNNDVILYDIGFTGGGIYFTDCDSPLIDNIYVDAKKMSMTISVKGLSIHKTFFGVKQDYIFEFKFPYKIKSVNTNEANEIIISEDRQTLTLVYVHKDINTPGDSETYTVDEEIVIKYKK